MYRPRALADRVNGSSCRRVANGEIVHAALPLRQARQSSTSSPIGKGQAGGRASPKPQALRASVSATSQSDAPVHATAGVVQVEGSAPGRSLRMHRRTRTPPVGRAPVRGQSRPVLTLTQGALHKPSHRRGLRPIDRQDKRSGRRRSGYTEVPRGTRPPAGRFDHCQSKRRETPRARPHHPYVASRWQRLSSN